MLPALIHIVVVLVIAGLFLWALGQFSIDATIAKLIRVAVIVFATICLLYYLLSLVGHGHPVLF